MIGRATHSIMSNKEIGSHECKESLVVARKIPKKLQQTQLCEALKRYYAAMGKAGVLNQVFER